MQKNKKQRREELNSLNFGQLVKIVEKHDKKAKAEFCDWHKQSRRSVVAQIIRYEFPNLKCQKVTKEQFFNLLEAVGIVLATDDNCWEVICTRLDGRKTRESGIHCSGSEEGARRCFDKQNVSKNVVRVQLFHNEKQIAQKTLARPIAH